MTSVEKEEMFITCDVCRLPYTGIKPFEQHMKGKKLVADKETQTEVMSLNGDSCLEEAKGSGVQDYTCSLCETVFTGTIPYNQHLKSKHHAKIVRRKKAQDDTAQLGDIGNYSEMPDCNDDDQSEILKKFRQEPYKSCSICEKKFNGPKAYSQHMKGKSHAKRKCELQLLKKEKASLSTWKDNDSEDGKTEKGFQDAEGQQELKSEDCDKVFNDAVPFAQHLTSKTHVMKESQNKLLKALKVIRMLELEDDSPSSEDEVSSELLTCEIYSMLLCSLENLRAHIESKKHENAIKWKK